MKKKVGKITLGEVYRDTHTGLEGKAGAYCQYLTGCDQVRLDHVVGGEWKTAWIDVALLEGVELEAKTKRAGGPQSTPPARHP